MFSRACTHAFMNLPMSSVHESSRTKSSIEYAARVNLRMLMQGPTSDRGGMITLTREPSGSRASTMGLLSSTRRPSGDTIRSMIRVSSSVSLNRTSVLSSRPARST